jgi:hypothetical protein
MPVRNQNWYNLQSTRRYPLDDKSTGLSDAGEFIPDDIIVDCHIRFPNNLGTYLYVQGITVSENLVTIVFGAAETLTSTANPTIAALSVTKPGQTNIHYSITPMVAGVGGWVVLGKGIENKFSGRYTTAEQTYIGFRNGRAYTPLPIPTLGKINLATALSGLVGVSALRPVTAEYIDETNLPEEQRLPKYDPVTQTTDYEPIRAIRFSTQAPSIVFNPLTYFLGPCGQRPESGTCPKQPIERINGVQPDCENGNINIIGDNGISVRTFAECGGADITTDTGLTEACREPDRDPDRGDDKCPCDSPYDRGESWCWPPINEDLFICPEDSGEPCPPLPVCVSFSPCHESLFEIASGSFINRATDAPPVCCPTGGPAISNHDTYFANRAAGANIALYKGCASDWTFNHAVAVEVKPTSGGNRQNGGVVINYLNVIEGGRRRTKYIAAIVDTTLGEFQIHRFDGSNLIQEAALPVSGVAVNQWYKIAVTASVNGTATTISAALYDKMSNTQIAALSTSVEDYEAIDGRAGLFSINSSAYFNKFEVT